MNITDLKNMLREDRDTLQEKEDKIRKNMIFRLNKYDELINYLKQDAQANVRTDKFIEIYKQLYPGKKLPEIISNHSYNHILNKLLNEYDFLKIEYSNLYTNKFIEDKYTIDKILSDLKNKKALNKREIEYIIDRLKKENIEEKEIINVIVQLQIHNAISKNNKENKYELYQMRDIINTGFEQIKLPKEENEKLNFSAENLVNSIYESRNEEVQKLLSTLDYLSDEEKKYLYAKMLNIYQNKILKLQELLGNIEIYEDKEAVSMIKDEFNDIVEKYSIIRDFYDDIGQNKISNDTVTESNDKFIRRLYYSTNNKGNEKCYFVRDLMNIREESYETILQLLKDFKTGDNSKLKKLTDYDNTIEIKEDQIRIILRILGKNNYSVLGVFIKKDDNDRTAYRNTAGRITAKIDDEYSKLVEDYLEEFVHNNSRKGTRK